MSDNQPSPDHISCAAIRNHAQNECLSTLQYHVHELRAMFIHVMALESEIEGHTDITRVAGREIIAELMALLRHLRPRLIAIVGLPSATEESVYPEMRKLTRRRNSAVRNLTAITNRYRPGYTESVLIPWVWKHLPQDLFNTISPVVVSWVNVAMAYNLARTAGLANSPDEIGDNLAKSFDRTLELFETALTDTVDSPLTPLQRNMARAEERHFRHLVEEGVVEKNAYASTMVFLEKTFQPLAGDASPRISQ